MWPFKSNFERGLARQARGMFLLSQDATESKEETMLSATMDVSGFYHYKATELGRLCGLILAQAQCDGASRVQFYYSKNRMVYTIQGTDYDMVPCPMPMNVDMVRAIVRASHTSWHAPGLLRVLFADLELDLVVVHGNDSEDSYIEVTEFTGLPRSAKKCA